MEVTRLPSRGVSSFPCCPSLGSNATTVSARSASLVTASVLVASPRSFPLKQLRQVSPSLRYGSSFGAVTLLLLAPELLLQKRLPEPVEGRRRGRNRNGSARAYLETSNPVMKFLSKVQGAIPVVGLISRLLSPEGGIGTDRIRFEEFCTRVGRNCSLQDSSAFYKMAAKYGKSAKAPFVLIWCWAAALGAGLLRSEDLLLGASRLRISYDIQFEVENFDLLMDEATKKREKSGSQVPDVPMESRAEKALEAMCICCTNRKDIAEEDAPLFSTILKVVFPTADKEEIDSIVAARIFDPFPPNPAASDDESQDSEDGQEEEEEAEASVDDQDAAVVAAVEQQKAAAAAAAEQQEAAVAAVEQQEAAVVVAELQQESADEQPRSVVQELLQ